MRIIAIIGNIGCGKTYATQVLLEEFIQSGFKAKAINLDKLGHKLIADKKMKSKLEFEFGPYSSRNELAKVAFANEKNLAKLNELIHPAIYDMTKDEIWKFSNENIDIVIVEVTAYDGKDKSFLELADLVVFVYAELEIRRKRALERGTKPDKLEDIIRRQVTSQHLKDVCDLCIDNSGSVDDLQIQCAKLVSRISESLNV